MVAAFRKFRAAGMDLSEAIKAGATQQLRPVLMTALLAMLGLVPAAISTEAGSEVQKPLAIVIIGGLLAATVLTLICMPYIYRKLSGSAFS